MTALEGDDNHPAKRLGRKLREARIAAGFTSQERFSAEMNIDRTAISRIETGNRHITHELLRNWCALCHVDYELYEAGARLAWVTEASPLPDWFENFFRAQTLAHTIRAWQPIQVPGPLQTPDYARAMHKGAGTPDALIDERIATRIDLQQQTLERKPVPVTLLAVMDEAVLHRVVGSDEIRHKQLLHLAEQAQRTHIGVQVVPAERGANAGNVGAFTIASLDDAEVMLQDGVEDVPTDKRASIRASMAIFDRVRLDALSQAGSIELIMKVADSCKP